MNLARGEATMPSPVPGLVLTNLRIRYVKGNYMFSLFLTDIVAITLDQYITRRSPNRGLLLGGILIGGGVFLLSIENPLGYLLIITGLAVAIVPYFQDSSATVLNLTITDKNGHAHKINAKDMPATQIINIIDSIEECRMSLM